MSADNGIYIVQAADGTRFKHLQAVENLFFHDGEDQRREPNYFEFWWAYKDSENFLTKDACLITVFEAAKYYEILEYGISTILITVLNWEEIRQRAIETAKIEIARLKRSNHHRAYLDYEISRRERFLTEAVIPTSV